MKENEILSPDSKSSQQFVHGIKVLVARNYSQNLGEETIKGMTEKARAGMYPSCAPIGYTNADGPEGKRVIVPDPNAAPVIRQLFELFASGTFSLKGLATKARADGLTLRGARIHKSTLHQILRKRLYCGDFDFNGATYQGTYEPLVPKDTWERVQELLDSHGKTNRHRIKRDFAFSGLVQCGHCGCMLVAEIKKARYTYYHCTGHRGKCEEPYTREELLVEQFARNLSELVIPREVAEWLQATYVESDLTERAARERTIRQHRAQYERLEARIETLYNDRLDGRISPTFYDAKAGEIRAQQQAILRRIEHTESSAPAPVGAAIDLMQLTSRAATLFRQQTEYEQRRLLQTVVKTASWQAGELRIEFEQPFEILRGSNRATVRKEMQIAGSGRDSEIWLTKQVSNFALEVNRPRRQLTSKRVRAMSVWHARRNQVSPPENARYDWARVLGNGRFAGSADGPATGFPISSWSLARSVRPKWKLFRQNNDAAGSASGGVNKTETVPAQDSSE